MLNAIPGLLVGTLVPDLFREMAEVCVSRHEVRKVLIFPNVGAAEDKFVVLLAEGVSVDGYRLEDDFRVVGGGLPAGRAVVVPLRTFRNICDFSLDGARFGSEVETSAVQPNILEDGVATLVKLLRVGVKLEEGLMVGVAHGSVKILL